MGKTKISELPDAFASVREAKGVGIFNDQGDEVAMLLRLKDVRKTAKDPKNFRSQDDRPGKIVVPHEMDIAQVRQIPFEVDPPEHTSYRNLVEPWFKRPDQEEYQTKLKAIVEDTLNEVTDKSSIEVVTEFSLKLQSRALTLLLNTPFEESETWISWGTHVFRSDDNPVDGDKANVLFDYLDDEIERASKTPSDDLYSVLLSSEINGKKLTKEEIKGVMVLTFAGGRDTVINAVTNTIAYLGDHPEALHQIKGNPSMIPHAVEELVRYFSPLTHMGRVVDQDTSVCEHAAKADSRVSLCWASANRDKKTFENPNEVNLDRKMNPHVGFGFGIHKCLGATHARQVLRTLLLVLSEKVSSIDLHGAEDKIEEWDEFQRKVGFE
ncbi:MAG: cytochrome P450, partial [Bacteroidota bacterium]